MGKYENCVQHINLSHSKYINKWARKSGIYFKVIIERGDVFSVCSSNCETKRKVYYCAMCSDDRKADEYVLCMNFEDQIVRGNRLYVELPCIVYRDFKHLIHNIENTPQYVALCKNLLSKHYYSKDNKFYSCKMSFKKK